MRMPLAAVLVLGLTGCVGGRSPDARYFQLQAEAGPPTQTAPLDPSLFVVIRPVGLEAYLRQPRMAERVAPHEIVYREFARWAEPLDRNIARVVTDNLRRILRTDRIASVPQAVSGARVVSLWLEISQLECQPDGRCRLQAGWLLQNEAAAGAEVVGTAEFAGSAAGPSPADQAAAQSKLLTDLSRRIATDIMSGPWNTATPSP